jgi:hypothetical protein
VSEMFQAIIVPQFGRVFSNVVADGSVQTAEGMMEQVGAYFQSIVDHRLKSFGWLPHMTSEVNVKKMPLQLKGIMHCIVFLVGTGLATSPTSNQTIRRLFNDLMSPYEFSKECFLICETASDGPGADKSNNVTKMSTHKFINFQHLVFKQVFESIETKLKVEHDSAIPRLFADLQQVRLHFQKLNLKSSEIRALAKLECHEDLKAKLQTVRAATSAPAASSNETATGNSNVNEFTFDIGVINPSKKSRRFKNMDAANHGALQFMKVCADVFSTAYEDALKDNSKAVEIANGLSSAIKLASSTKSSEVNDGDKQGGDGEGGK